MEKVPTTEQIPMTQEQVGDGLREMARMRKLREQIRDFLSRKLIYSDDQRRFEFRGLEESGEIMLRQVDPIPTEGSGDLKVDPDTFSQMFTLK